MKTIYFIAIAVLLLLTQIVKGQYTPADYSKADSLIGSFEKLILNKPLSCEPIRKTGNFWYSTNTTDGKQYFIVDSKKKVKTVAFDKEKLRTLLAAKLESKVEEAFDIQNFKVKPSLDTLEFDFKGYNWTYSRKKNILEKGDKIEAPEKAGHWAKSRDELGQKPIISPDKKWSAYIKEYNVYVKNVEKGKEYQLSYDGSPGEYYSSYIEWSPNSKYIVTNKFRPNEKRSINFMESSPKNQIQPILHTVEYLKPGDALPIKQPSLFNIEEKKQIAVDCSSFLKQYNLSDIEWRKDSRAFTFEYNERGHQCYQVVNVDVETGNVSLLIDEQCKTFIFYNANFRYDVNDGEEIIWVSERDGWKHLYLYDGKGNVKNQITKGEWIVRNVKYVDEAKREILFCGNGMNKDEDPYLKHYYRIGFNGSGLKDLTPELANHDVTFSSDSLFMIDYISRTDMPGKTVLRNTATGAIEMELETTSISGLAEKGWQMPEVFSANGRDGVTGIWGNIYRPSNFDPNKKYPIIEYIYAGPHDSFVPKSFTGVNRRFAAMAELGFVCVTIDGMGTANRSKAFHDVCWKNLKDAGFPDRILWMKAAAEKYNYMDTTRVGIYGGSAGGQNALTALLFYPEFYKAATSSCGCHDNRMDKMWWNEQWMGYPIGKEYEECSNVVNASKLQGKLMLILGEVDDNVDPSSTMQVADALIKANKEFELVVLPGVNHTLGGDYGERKRRDFFVKNFLNIETPNWNKK